jgi:hypothetical protein
MLHVLSCSHRLKGSLKICGISSAQNTTARLWRESVTSSIYLPTPLGWLCGRIGEDEPEGTLLPGSPAHCSPLSEAFPRVTPGPQGGPGSSQTSATGPHRHPRHTTRRTRQASETLGRWSVLPHLYPSPAKFTSAHFRPNIRPTAGRLPTAPGAQPHPLQDTGSTSTWSRVI